MSEDKKSPASGQAGRAGGVSSCTADSHNDNVFTISDGKLLRALLVDFELWALERVRSDNASGISETWLISTVGKLKCYLDDVVYSAHHQRRKAEGGGDD